MKKTLLIFALVVILLLTACGNVSDSSTKPTFDNSISTKNEENEINTDIKATSLDELENLVVKDVENTIDTLKKTYEELTTKIDTYDKYKEHKNEVKSFYSLVVVTNKNLSIRLREYALIYAELILKSDDLVDDKYEEMENLYDVVYDDAGDDVYDEIYDGILDDIYKRYYDGILDDAYDTVEYDEWSDLHSDEYDWWSDASSDVYDDWSDFRSDVYDFWSDVRGELWDKDIEKAIDIKEDFKSDINKLKK